MDVCVYVYVYIYISLSLSFSLSVSLCSCLPLSLSVSLYVELPVFVLARGLGSYVAVCFFSFLARQCCCALPLASLPLCAEATPARAMGKVQAQ